MKTKADYIEANRQLATLKGWTNIKAIIGCSGLPQALIGSPPWKSPNSRQEARVPDWCGDWDACGKLLGEYLIGIWPWPSMAVASAHCDSGVYEAPAAGADYYEHEHRDAALRYAIVLAAIKAAQALDNQGESK